MQVSPDGLQLADDRLSLVERQPLWGGRAQLTETLERRSRILPERPWLRIEDELGILARLDEAPRATKRRDDLDRCRSSAIEECPCRFESFFPSAPRTSP